MDEKDRCKTCKGNKVVDEPKTIEVAIEPGVPSEHDYIYHGECDEYPGVMGGDLHVRVMIANNARFTRKGADLYMEKKISLIEALTGLNFEFKHLDGELVKCTTLP
jgi:DnaJ family protein A protein 2